MYGLFKLSEELVTFLVDFLMEFFPPTLLVTSDSSIVYNDTEELFELISQAKQIREGSLNGSLSDEERFAQAEKTAIRLAELFGLDEEAGK